MVAKYPIPKVGLYSEVHPVRRAAFDTDTSDADLGVLRAGEGIRKLFKCRMGLGGVDEGEPADTGSHRSASGQLIFRQG